MKYEIKYRCGNLFKQKSRGYIIHVQVYYPNFWDNLNLTTKAIVKAVARGGAGAGPVFPNFYGYYCFIKSGS